MQAPLLPSDEEERLAALRALDILDSDPEDRYDRITQLALRLFEVPIAYVAMVDANRQWFKSCFGLPFTETAREVSFCGHAILEEDVLVIPDATADPRFADNPMVVEPPRVRFYAGRPLRAGDGHKVGTLCLMSQEPREFGEGDRELLEALAGVIERELQLGAAVQLQRQVIEAKRRSDRLLDVVIPVGVALSSRQDFRDLLETLVAGALSISDAEGAALFVRHRDDSLRCELLVLTEGELHEWRPGLESELSGDRAFSLVGSAAEGSSVCWHARERVEGEDDPLLECIRRRWGVAMEASVALPLVGADGRTIGVLQLADTEDPEEGPGAFPAGEVELLEALASLAAAALAGYSREQTLREQIRELELKIDVVERDRQVEEITQSSYFQQLRDKIAAARAVDHDE